jgi:hypothetical protein
MAQRKHKKQRKQAMVQLFDGNTEISEPCQKAIKKMLMPASSAKSPSKLSSAVTTWKT